jgi:hypothetical protein
MARMLRQLVPQMSVDAEEIEMGKSYATSHPKDCGTCDGSGLLGRTCRVCGGARIDPGRLRTLRHPTSGNLHALALEVVCQHCRGSGREPCPNSRRVVFTVPPDVRPGWILEGKDDDGGSHYAQVTSVSRQASIPSYRTPRSSCTVALAVALGCLATAVLLASGQPSWAPWGGLPACLAWSFGHFWRKQ